MKRELEMDHLVVPNKFKVGCKVAGFQVHEFLQLFVDHYSLIDNHFDDKSAFSLATKSFYFIREEFGLEGETMPNTMTRQDKDKGVGFVRRMVKLATNRNYSFSQRRNKSKVLTGQLFELFSKGVELKDTVYLDEFNFIKLNKDIRFQCILTGASPVELLNAIMQYVDMPNHLARFHLEKFIFNPVLGFFIRVMDGYGNIRDSDYLDSEEYAEFIWSLQELPKQFYFYRNLEDRIEIYQEWLGKFLEENRF
ncbi:hypothetical protein [Sphingobacterium gobiense]|nr:hypothetical protein [Sphingobacterium gobiense]